MTYFLSVKCLEFDKYGRLLVELFSTQDVSNTKSFNSTLIDKNLSVTYDGGKKINHGLRNKIIQ